MRKDEYESEISQKVGGIMKFRRIDEDTVRCIVSKEDMQEFGIVLEDFFKNKSKIHDFLHEVVERAEQDLADGKEEAEEELASAREKLDAAQKKHYMRA